MTDEERFYTLDEETLRSFFSLTPEDTGCSIDSLELMSSIDDLTAWPTDDPRVSFEGELGNMTIKLDKTVRFTRPLSLFLKATTKGLNSAIQEIEFLVCPEGGAIIHSPMNPVFSAVTVGASGTDANAFFAPFSGEQVEGCSGGWQFDRFEISADTETSSLIQWPEPGKTVEDCVEID